MNTVARELAVWMTAQASVTDTDGEAQFAFRLRDKLAAWPYFKAHPERLRLLRTLDDARERYVLAIHPCPFFSPLAVSLLLCHSVVSKGGRE